MHCLQSAFGDRLISIGFWPPHSPHLKSCSFNSEEW